MYAKMFCMHEWKMSLELVWHIISSFKSMFVFCFSMVEKCKSRVEKDMHVKVVLYAWMKNKSWTKFGVLFKRVGTVLGVVLGCVCVLL